jgi:3-hydroxybutyryl-CoA dehydrogenase
MNINKIGLIGAGTMGGGIAMVFALYNYPVILVDREESILKGAKEKIKKRTELELWNKVLGLIEFTTDRGKLKDCDLIIEAVFEEVEIKRGVFNTLNNICKKDAIIATNTSSLSINKLSKFIDYPARFIGMHFMNPPRVMKLIEIVKGEKTSDETVKTITELTKEIGKMPALVNDSPGFISNRLLFALIGEAMRLLEKGVAKKEDIDTVMKYGMNHPMGPIELADFIGLDVCHKIMLSLYESLGDERYKPTPLLESLVREGKLGRKTKEGFYKYP